jgi:nicotinamidase/pyrazinamidase
MKNIYGIFIDFNNDFLDDGSLPVKGGRQASKNSASLIKRLKKKFNQIWASMDCHQKMQIFHPKWHLNKKNQNPGPYQPITHQDYLDGTWRCSIGNRRYKDGKTYQQKTEEYLKELESKSKLTLVSWPEHALVSTKGWLLEESFTEALYEWEEENLRRVNFIAKGSNPFTEFYSAFEAEVFQPDDPSTGLNTKLVQALEEADEIVWGGLVLEYCLRHSMKSILDNFSNTDYIKKCVLLRDCTESLDASRQVGEDFIKEYEAKGLKVCSSKDYLA